MVKVSIIVPIYNVEKYLWQCLDSCINQTLKEIEIICINDGCTDKSPDIISEYAQKDSRIKVINQQNLGLSAARNAGVEVATGEYILFLDSDDWLSSDCCKVAYNQAKKNNNDFVWFAHKIYDESTKKIIKARDLISCEKLFDKKQVDLKQIKDINYINVSYVWNKLYNHKWLIDNNFKFVSMRAEDTPYTIDVILKSNSISYINKPLYFYRRRKDSLTWSIDVDLLMYSKTLPISYILEDKKKYINVLHVYFNYYYNCLLNWYYSLPLDKNEKIEFKNAMIKEFTNFVGQDYRAGIYVFLLKTGLCRIFYSYIRKLFVFLSRIPYYTKYWKELLHE